MQKRLLALVATVAIVLSMFAGVAFAAIPVGATLEHTDPAVTPDATDATKYTATVIAWYEEDGTPVDGLEYPANTGDLGVTVAEGGTTVTPVVSYVMHDSHAAFKIAFAFEYGKEYTVTVGGTELVTVNEAAPAVSVQLDQSEFTVTPKEGKYNVHLIGQMVHADGTPFQAVDYIGLSVTGTGATVTNLVTSDAGFAFDAEFDSIGDKSLAFTAAGGTATAKVTIADATEFVIDLHFDEETKTANYVYGTKVTDESEVVTWDAKVTGSVKDANGNAPTNAQFNSVVDKTTLSPNGTVSVLSYSASTGAFELGLSGIENDDGTSSKPIALKWEWSEGTEVSADAFFIKEYVPTPELVLSVPAEFIVDKNANGKLDVVIKGTLKEDGKPLGFSDFLGVTFKVNGLAKAATEYDAATGTFTLPNIEVAPDTVLTVECTKGSVTKTAETVAKATPPVVEQFTLTLDEDLFEGKPVEGLLDVSLVGTVGELTNPQILAGTFKLDGEAIEASKVGVKDGKFYIDLKLAPKADAYKLTWENKAANQVSDVVEFQVKVAAQSVELVQVGAVTVDPQTGEYVVQYKGRLLHSDGTPFTDAEYEGLSFKIDGEPNSKSVVLDGYFYLTAWFDKAGEKVITIDAAGLVAPLNYTITVAPTVKAGKIVLDKKDFVLGDPIKLTGKIVDADGKLIKKNFNLDIVEKMYDEADSNGYFDGRPDLYYPGDVAFGGYINLEIKPLPVRDGRYTYQAPICPGKYTLVATYGADRYELQFVIADDVESDTDLGFTWNMSMTKNFTYSNRLPYGLGNVPVRLVLQDADDELVETWSANVNGRAFYFEIPRDEFPHVGDLVVEYYVNKQWVPLVKGEIAVAKVGLTISPDVAIFGSGTPATYKVTTANTYAPKDKEIEWVYSIVDKDDNVLSGSFDALNAKEAKVTLAPIAADRNKVWTAKVVGKIDGVVCYKGEAPFRVVRPDRYNLIGLAKEIELTQEGYDIDPGNKVVVTYYAGKDTYLPAYDYVITANGAGIVDFEWDSKEDTDPAILLPTHGGDIDITIKAYKADGEHIATFYEKITVNAGQMTVEPAAVARNKAQNVVVKLVDVDGKVVNNAYIFVTDTARDQFEFDKDSAKVDPEKINIRGGEYTLKMTAAQLEDAGTFNIYAIVNDKDGQTWMAIGELEVLGDNVYGVSVSAEDLLAGKNTETVITVKDADGKYVKPTSVSIKYDDNKSAKCVVGAKSGDGYKVTIPAINFAGEATIVASTDGGNYYGEQAIEVYKPQLVVDVEKITDQVNSKLNFKLVDPRSEEEVVLDWDVAIKAEYAEYYTVQKWDYVGKALRDVVFEQDNYVQLLGSDKEHQMLFLLNADYFTAEKDDKVPCLVFEAKYDDDVTLDTVVEIGQATLTPEPKHPVAGRDNKVIFTLADANGNPLVGYKVYRAHFMDAELAKTDENGQFVYEARMDGVESFAAELDYWFENEKTGQKEYGLVTAQITPSYDTEKPVLVDVPEKTDKAVYELVIEDNVKIVKVYIDEKEQFIVPGEKVSVKLNLQLGENKFRVTAIDSSDNAVDEEIVITYAPAGVKLTIGKTEYVANGETKTMEAAPYLKGDHTMIPVRALETFGVKYAWDQDTKTATFELDENVVKVTVGSTTAVVNGEQAAVPVAPEIVNNRTMAPLRFVLQNLGLKVHWVPGGEITITR